MFPIDFQIDLAAAAIAIIALAFSVWTWRHQRALESERLRSERDSDVIKWSNEVLLHLCRAEMVVRPEWHEVVEKSEYERERYEILAAISYLIDAGRLYFPNVEHTRYGLSKQAAFRGFRHKVLDDVVYVYDCLRGAEFDAKDLLQRRESVVQFKRSFISGVQETVDPRRRIQFLEKVAQT